MSCRRSDGETNESSNLVVSFNIQRNSIENMLERETFKHVAQFNNYKFSCILKISAFRCSSSHERKKNDYDVKKLLLKPK